jgi:VWFA-related protein
MTLPLAVVFLAVAAASQSSPPAQQDSTRHNDPPQNNQLVNQPSTVLRSVTRLVIVDVVAMDSKGEPVTDLSAGDFKVLEDGKAQEIRVFNFQHPTQAVQSLSPLPPNVFTNVPRYQHNTSSNVIILDGLNSSFEHVADMRRSMLDFLKNLSRDEPVAIYGLNKRLELLQDFTTPAQALQAAGQQASPTESQSKIAKFMPNLEPVGGCLREQMTIMALHWIAKSLAGFPGRKNLIWISDRFPFGIYTELSQYPDSCLVNTSKEITETVDDMLDREIAVYPIVAEGLENHDYDPAGPAGTQGLVGGQRFRNSIALSNRARTDRLVQMNDLAKKTGGEAFHDRNDLDMTIRKSIDDGSTYYTLGYYPANKKWDGQFRHIEVKVNRDGLHLRYRLGYFATEAAPAQNAQSRGKAMNDALAPELPSLTAVLFEAAFVPPSSQTDNQAVVRFAIDPSAISFDRSADQTAHASVDCVIKVYSLKGELLKTASSTMEARLKPDVFSKVMQSSFPCQQKISLDPGSYLLKLGVIDNRTGQLGTTTGKITF